MAKENAQVLGPEEAETETVQVRPVLAERPTRIKTILVERNWVRGGYTESLETAINRSLVELENGGYSLVDIRYNVTYDSDTVEVRHHVMLIARHDYPNVW